MTWLFGTVFSGGLRTLWSLLGREGSLDYKGTVREKESDRTVA